MRLRYFETHYIAPSMGNVGVLGDVGPFGAELHFGAIFCGTSGAQRKLTWDREFRPGLISSHDDWAMVDFDRRLPIKRQHLHRTPNVTHMLNARGRRKVCAEAAAAYCSVP